MAKSENMLFKSCTNNDTDANQTESKQLRRLKAVYNFNGLSQNGLGRINVANKQSTEHETV